MAALAARLPLVPVPEQAVHLRRAWPWRAWPAWGGTGSSRARRGWARRLALGRGRDRACSAGGGAALGRGRLAPGSTRTKVRDAVRPARRAGRRGDLAVAIGQGGLVCAAALGLIAWATRRPELAGLAAIVVMALDLGWANASIVRAVPQSDFEVMPRALARIAEAEKLDPAPGPYRVHRMPIWNPVRWRSPRRPTGSATSSVGTRHDPAQVRPSPRRRVHPDPGGRRTVRLRVVLLPVPPVDRPRGRPVARHQPRRQGGGLPSARLRPLELALLHPAVHASLGRPDRGIAAFLPDTTQVYPPPDAFRGPGRPGAQERWAARRTSRSSGTRTPTPAPGWSTTSGSSRRSSASGGRERKETMEELLFADDLFWRDPQRTVYDPKRLAWIETDRPERAGRPTSRRGNRPGAKPSRSSSSPGPGRPDADPRTPGAGDPRRRLLSRLDADDRRPARADPPRQPPDARRRRAVRRSTAWSTPTTPPRSASARRLVWWGWSSWRAVRRT